MRYVRYRRNGKVYAAAEGQKSRFDELKGDDVLAALATLPGVASARFYTGRVVLTVAQLHIALPGVLEALRARDLELANLSTHHATLEDVFIDLTGRELR